MARYSARTAIAAVNDIDVVFTAGAIAASAVEQSAFMPNVLSRRGPRIQIWTKRASFSGWAAHTEGAEPDETAYNPTSVTTTNTTRYLDAVLEQGALQDAATGDQPLQDQVIAEGAISYADYFDAQCAAEYSNILSTGADHVIGSATSAITGPLIDQGVEKLLIAGAPGMSRIVLVVHTTKIREVMQIPGIREKAILGGRGGGVEGPMFGSSNSRFLANYGGIVDIYHSDQIVATTSPTTRHNLMFAVGDGGPTQAALVNPWSPMMTPEPAATKMHVDVVWNEARRSVEINMSTIEDFSWRDSATVSQWAVDLNTA